jgi:hypothetical protein
LRWARIQLGNEFSSTKSAVEKFVAVFVGEAERSPARNDSSQAGSSGCSREVGFGDIPPSITLESDVPHDWQFTTPAAFTFPHWLHLITFAPHFRQTLLLAVYHSFSWLTTMII